MKHGFLFDSNQEKSRPKRTFLDVPVDILIKIFHSVAVLERAVKQYEFCDYPTELLPVRLSHVSSLLRAVVLNRPLLWTTFHGGVLPYPLVVDAYLARSQRSPIDIHINEDYLDDALQNMSRLVRHVHRWRTLHVSGDNDGKEWMDIVTRIRHLHAPILEDLQLSVLEGSDERDMPSFFSTFSGGTPSLRSLQLTTEALYFPTQWNTVTRLSLHCLPGAVPRMSYSQFCNILADLSSLTQIQLIGEIMPWPWMQGVKTLCMPSLESVFLWCVEDPDALPWDSEHQCLSALCMTLSPNTLRHLALNDVTPKILTHFLSLLRRGTIHFPNVTSLYWQICLNSSKDVPDIVSAFPAIESLTLMEDSDKFLEVLLRMQMQWPMQEPLWPHLRMLDIPDVKPQLLRDFLSSRQILHHPICRVRLGSKLASGNEVADWLRENVELEFVTLTVLTLEGTRWEDD